MPKATDVELGKLHKHVAEAFLNALQAQTEADMLIKKYDGELPDDVVDFLTKASNPSPALLSAAIKFLKDNEITCAIEDSDAMLELEKRLRDKRKLSDLPDEQRVFN